MKNYTKYSDKNLIPILKNIIEELNSKNIHIETMDDVEDDFDQITNIITNELNSYITYVDFEDVSYFISLILINDDFDSPLKKPELKTYRVQHIYKTSEVIGYTYQNDIKSFIPINLIIGDLQDNGYYEPFDGDMIDKETIDTDWIDDYIDKIRELKTKK